MPSYFLGNILGPLDKQPEQHDKTFMFTHEEAKDLELEGVPIRMEHHPDMEVGKIDRCFQGKDGSKWIIAHINEDSIQSHFASKAIQPNKNGTTYYTGLSLQHEHVDYKDGSSKKFPVEVSLCVEPRRSDCRIKRVFASTKRGYICTHKAHKMTEPEKTETPTDITKDLENALLQQENKIKEQAAQLEAFQKKEAERLEAEKKRQEAEEAERQKKLELERAKADAMFQAVANEWHATLPKEEFPDEVKNQIQTFIKNSPEQSMELLRLAHCASKHYAAKAKAFEEALQNKQVEETKKDLVESVTKKRKVVHAASAKPKSVMEVLSQYRNSAGSGRELMLEKLEIDKNRMPYY